MEEKSLEEIVDELNYNEEKFKTFSSKWNDGEIRRPHDFNGMLINRNPPKETVFAAIYLISKEDLLFMIKYNNFEDLETYLYYNSELKWSDIPNAFELSVEEESYECAKILLEYGWNIKWEKHKPLLTNLIKKSNQRFVKLLLKWKWKIKWNSDCLDVAISMYEFEISFLLISKGKQKHFADNGYDALETAIDQNSEIMLNALKNNNWVLPLLKERNIYSSIFQHPNIEIFKILLSSHLSSRWWKETYNNLGLIELAQIEEEADLNKDFETANKYRNLIILFLEKTEFPEDIEAINDFLFYYPHYHEIMNNLHQNR